MPRRKTTTKKPNERKMLKPVNVRLTDFLEKSRKKKIQISIFKKSSKVKKSNLKNSVGNGVTQVKNRAGEPTAHGMYFCTVCANTLRDEI